MSNLPFTFSELETQLNNTLELVLSTDRTTSDIANALKDLSREQQEFVIKWSIVSSRSNAELAYQFVENSASAFRQMTMDDVHNWLIQAMDVYDKQGLYQAATVLRKVDEFALVAREKTNSISFEEVAGVLEKFICGLSGRDLKLEPGDIFFTRSEEHTSELQSH